MSPRPRATDPKVQIRVKQSTRDAAQAAAKDGQTAGDALDELARREWDTDSRPRPAIPVRAENLAAAQEAAKAVGDLKPASQAKPDPEKWIAARARELSRTLPKATAHRLAKSEYGEKFGV